MIQQPIAFVRQEGEYLAEQAPPRSGQGLVGWMRTNLFATWTDRIVTTVVVVLLAWMAWGAFDSWVLSANTTGKTQAEGQLAEIISGVESDLAEAQAMAERWEREADALVAAEVRNLRALARLIEATDLDALDQVVRLGHARRLVPLKIDQMITIAQSKLPLSVYARLAVVRRQIEDPDVAQITGLDGLTLSDAEAATLVRASQPWTTLDPASRAQFQAAAREITNTIGAIERTDAGRAFVDLDAARARVATLVADNDGENLIVRPTRIALQFGALVNGVVGTPITNIPVSRLQKMRKDTLSPAQIDDVKEALALERFAAQGVEPTSQQLNAAKNALTDAELFLNPTMPAGLPEAIESEALLDALAAMNFWDVAQTLAEPTGETLATTATESLTTEQKAPLVLDALLDNFSDQAPGPENFAGATLALVSAYDAQDLAAMEAAWAHFEPLQRWADGNDGANWAVIANNWQRMLWGAYPQEHLWRVGIVALGFVIALLPLVAPACRNAVFYAFTAVFPVFVLFMLSGLSLRFFGFTVPQDANWFEVMYSDLGKVIQAAVALGVIAAAFVAQRGALGKTAGPALVTAMLLSALYFIIMVWGTVINPPVAQQNILVEANYTGFVTAENRPDDLVSPDEIRAEIDALNEASQAPGISAEQSRALRVQAFELRPELGRAGTREANFANVVAQGQGTFIVLPFVPSQNWGGLLVTMVLGVLGMAASLPIGIVLAFGRQSTLPIVRWFSTATIELVRGVPLVALLLIVVFLLPKLLPPGADYPQLGLVFAAICLFGGVYQAEVVRGGLQSLPKGQYEAAQALGLNFWQMSRMITLPQALKAVIPAIVNTFIGLFKDTTLVIVVSILDFLTISELQITADIAWNTTKLESLLVISLVFFILMFGLSRYSMWLERRLATDHR